LGEKSLSAGALPSCIARLHGSADNCRVGPIPKNAKSLDFTGLAMVDAQGIEPWTTCEKGKPAVKENGWNLEVELRWLCYLEATHGGSYQRKRVDGLTQTKNSWS
jgi:hypothetical protein